ncbi:hypothetical protein K4F52_000861 [Lecanicillium sp. MT-2017a]|nr:hypothetical protein K4F52_000861 [Lecanicillium sp. MT-2017a]
MSNSDYMAAAVGSHVAVEAVANPGSEPTASPMQPTSAKKEAQLIASESSADEKAARSPPPILCLGIARTGSASLAKALNILGIEKVHHGLDMKGEEYEYQWRTLDRAADCVFPNIATYTGEPFGRADWDECFGGYDAATDMASFFALPLIAAYPDARVILVERDIDHWLPSIELIFAPWQKASVRRVTRWLPRWSETVSGVACGKMFEGWTRCERPEDLMKCARGAYERHYREIRAAVPPGQLLDLRLADGWEPLCRFLGKEVPEEPFPHVNDAAAYKENYRSEAQRILKHAAKRMFLPCIA